MNDDERKEASERLKRAAEHFQPKKPQSGDFISLDAHGCHPSDFNIGGEAIGWYCSQVISVEGNLYRVTFDDGERAYEFTEFGEPWLAKGPDLFGCYVFPAIPPAKPPQLKLTILKGRDNG